MNRERGATLVEYSVLILLISVAAIVSLRIMGEDITQVFETVVAAFQRVP